MTVRGSAFSVPGGTNLVGSIDASRVLLRIGEELVVYDVAAAAVAKRRAIPGLRYARLYGGWIQVEAAGAPALVRADLDGDEVRWPQADTLRLAGVVGSIALLSTHGEWARFDLERREEVGRGRDDASWYGVHAEAGLVLGVRERAREIVALRAKDGAIAWTAKPFPKRLDDLGHPSARGDEVHVRARAAGEGLVAKLRVRDGAVLHVRAAPSSLDSWLPDLGEEVDRLSARFARRRSMFAFGDAFVIPQDDQAVVVRASGVARVALPHLDSVDAAGGAILGLVADRTRIALVVAPLPASGEHDLELEPKGDDAAPAGDDRGVVTFAGTTAPIVIVQHPAYGRVNLTRSGSSAPPPLGAHVVLDGVEVKPGGVVRVERWWIAGARPERAVERVALGPAALARDGAGGEPTRHARSLVARAKEQGIAVPDDVLRLVELVDRDAPLRDALARLGFHFEEEELGLDVLPELDVHGFVPIWGNGFGDGYGGLTPAGVGYLYVKDERAPKPLPPLAAYVRAEARESEQEASAAIVLEALDAGGL